MQIQKRPPSNKGADTIVTGDVWFDPIIRGVEPSRVISGVAHFSPGGRTRWHAHAIGQTLYILEGIGWVQSRGNEVVEVRAGDVIFFSAGEWHWHGATATNYMAHLAISEAPATGEESQWGDHVSSEDYALK